jgi:hypothetical protein
MWKSKLKALGVDRSKFLTGQQLRARLDIKAMTMYRWMKIDPAFPEVHRPFGKKGYPVTLFAIRDVEEYERILAARREDLIKNILVAIERELRREVRISSIVAAASGHLQPEGKKMLPFLGSNIRWKDLRKD